MHPVIIIGTVRSLWTDTMGQIPRSTERISSCNYGILSEINLMMMIMMMMIN